MRRREERLRFLPVILIAWAVSAAPAAADDGPARDEQDAAFLTLSFENDLFGLGATDRHFTHGSRISVLSRPEAVPDLIREGARHVPLFESREAMRVSYVLGQNIYTPKDINQTTLGSDDRPYAGWLYGSVGLVSPGRHRLDTLQLTLGVVGPASLAEETQTEWHKLLDVNQPRGWSNQLKNEPGVVLTYERKWRGVYELPLFLLGADITPHVSGNIGNVFTDLGAGATVRFGRDLPADFGPPRIRPSPPGSGYFLPLEGVAWYLFAGVDGRVVARNIFLDGNTFTDSHSVDRKWLVGDFQAGLAITYERVRISYTHIVRSREFHGQDEADQFGSLSLSIRF